ncbi:GNAT family N-acetyltransferase [Candidatus Kaiserbacteria bacterium]|nr:GNAT family N-acetyltransferase [Candidatus Kaiserbacteria bacterium]
MQILIRAAGWRDFGALLHLQRQVVRESEHLAATGGERKEPIVFAFAKAVLHRKRVHTLLALSENQPVGYITIVFGKFRKVGETAYIVVGVRASHRGHGVGTALLTEAEKFARSRKMHRMELEVFEGNEGAVRLYEKLGYAIEGRRREAVKTQNGYSDIIWMGKLL